MDIAYLSNTYGQKPKLNLKGVDLLVAAGDIDFNFEKAFQYLKKESNGIPTIWVPGNCEFYGNRISETVKEMRALCRKTNIRVLHRSSVHIDGFDFHGVTLWTDFLAFGKLEKKNLEEKCAKEHPDFKHILGTMGYIQPLEIFKEHQKDLKWIKNKLSDSKDNTPQIVISHFSPFSSLRSGIVKGYDSNNCSMDLEKADLVIFGNKNKSSEFYTGPKEGTLAVSNPMGPKDNLNSSFENPAVLTIASNPL